MSLALRGTRGIVPYDPAMLGRLFLRNPRIRMAMNTYRVLKKHRRGIYNTGRGIARAYLRSRRGVANRARRVGGVRSPGGQNQAFYGADGIPTLAPSTILIERKTLWSAAIQTVKPPTNSEGLGQAVNNRFKLSGVKVCVNMQNQTNNPRENYIAHIAIIQPKEFQDASSRTPQVDNGNFFVNPGGGVAGTDRYLDFDNVAVDPDVDQRYNCNGINTQKWNVITHTKRTLMSINQASPNIWKYEKYFNMGKRTFEFEQVNDVFVTKPLYLVIWYERLTGDDSSSTANIQFTCNTIGYYRQSR